MGFWLKISICQSTMMHEGCWVNYVTRVGNLEASTVYWKRICNTGTIVGNQAAVDRIHHVAVEDLVLSQDDKSKRHRSGHEILHETAVLYSSVHRIIHSDLISNLNDSNDVVLSSCLKPSVSPVSLADKQPRLIVCNRPKSCYCFIINRKLSNK